MNADAQSRVFSALDEFSIEIPSWGFANTGTRFGKFLQAGAATTLEEKFAGLAEPVIGASRSRQLRAV